MPVSGSPTTRSGSLLKEVLVPFKLMCETLSQSESGSSEVISMPNRRQFLQAGISALLLPPLSRRSLAPRVPKSFDQVVFDQRYLKARNFAEKARQAGLECAAIEGDVTALYFHNLALRWSRGPSTIAGLSTIASLFCLDLLARDRGMRLVYCADVLDSQPEPDIPYDVPDHKLATISIVGEDRDRLVVWVIAPRGPHVRASEEEYDE
jgi:hypothetical protein